MTIEKLDRLPGPVEFRSKSWSVRKRYVGFGWVSEGISQGDEPILVMEKCDPNIPEGIEVWTCSSE